MLSEVVEVCLRREAKIVLDAKHFVVILNGIHFSSCL